MNIKIYQINSDRDSGRVKFMGLQSISAVSPGIYDAQHERDYGAH